MEKIKKSISLVIPVYNEKESVKPVAVHCLEILSKDFEDFEIILVDDGSNDGTKEALEELAGIDGRIRLVRNDVNISQGASIQIGIKIASKEFVMHNAIDLPLAVEDIAGLMAATNDCDLLVIERQGYCGYTTWRSLTSVINRILRKLIFPFLTRNIQDMNFTQIYRRNILNEIMPVAKSPAFTTPEMIITARIRGLRIKSVVCKFHPRKQGKAAFGKPRDILWTIYDMFCFRIRILRRQGKISADKGIKFLD